MIQWLRPYAWVVEAVFLGLLVGVIVASVMHLAEQHYWPDEPMRVLSTVEAMDRGWPAEWGE